MGIVRDILDLVGLLPQLKRLGEALGRVDDIERRTAALEQRLARCPGEGCGRCGELTLRVKHAGSIQGDGDRARLWRKDLMRCEECGHEEWRVIRY